MSTFAEDFQQAIEELQHERKSHGKRPYNVHYCPNPQDFVIVRIQGGLSGQKVEVCLPGRNWRVVVPQTGYERAFNKNDVIGVIDCIKDLLETPLANQ